MRIPVSVFGALAAATLLSASPAHAGVDLASVNDAWAQSALQGTATLEATQPELARSIADAAPRPSRSGQPLFVEPGWRTPEAAPAILVRIAEGSDSPEAQIGLLDALKRTQGDWGAGVVGLAHHETDPSVRRMMVEVLQYASVEHARAGVKLGMADRSEAVRAAAARVVGTHSEGAALADLVVPGLSDQSPTVREETARSIGYAGYTPAFDATRKLLRDSDAGVRFRALRSLDKLDASRTAGLSELSLLATDTDIKVAREAQKLQAR